jgi:hypothetical protein
MLDELGFKSWPVKIREDNQGCIALAKTASQHNKSKHIRLRYHYNREAVADGLVTLEYIRTSFNIADLFTKPLSKQRFETLRRLLGIVDQSKMSSGSVELININNYTELSERDRERHFYWMSKLSDATLSGVTWLEWADQLDSRIRMHARV